MSKSGPQKPLSIITQELCAYGCLAIAKYQSVSGKLMCETSSTKCPEIRRKNSESGKNSYLSGRKPNKQVYENLPQETKDRMAWTRGLTKENDSRVARPQFIGRKFGVSLTGHTKETKQKIAKARTEWLKNPLNRKNLGRHKRSWLELTFESYLKEQNITGWDTEVHFWNDELRKNYFTDFIFESKKLIIELDGTQHRKTVEQDSIRDNWFSTKGYKVIRISVDEFKKRYFSGQGFLDLMRV